MAWETQLTESLRSPKLYTGRIESSERIQHDMPLPARFVQHQSSHHAPAAPQPFPKVLNRFFLRTPAL